MLGREKCRLPVVRECVVIAFVECLSGYHLVEGEMKGTVAAGAAQGGVENVGSLGWWTEIDRGTQEIFGQKGREEAHAQCR